MSQVYTSPGKGGQISGEGEEVNCRLGSRGYGRPSIDVSRQDGVDGETRDAGA
jgi:hypothetical protein